jgi:hypothetical protein
VHPDPEYRLEALIFESDDDRETYICEPDLGWELPGELITKVLYTTVNRSGVVFLWPIKLMGEDGRIDRWNESALKAAQIAQEHWVRVSADMSAGQYQTFQAAAELSGPEWPKESF